MDVFLLALLLSDVGNNKQQQQEQQQPLRLQQLQKLPQ